MLARTFVDRPIFAWVLAILVMILGLGAVVSLPVSQYPDIAPPTVSIRANYPGANAEVLAGSVTQVIEQQLTGIDGLIYFQSTSSANGSVQITATFDGGTNPDIAQVQVQNKVQQALPRLPQQVQAQGITVTKGQTDFLMIVSLYDATDRTDSFDVSDYLASVLQDRIARLPGVGDFILFGSQYAMRVWLDPYKLARVQLMPGDVIAAIQAQNTQVSAGQVGQQPAATGQMLNATVTSRSRLQTPEQFRQIILKTQPDGSLVRLSDVARVEMGSESYGQVSRLNGHPASGMGVFLAPGADALATSELVRAEIDKATRDFPPGYRIGYPLDSTAFIKLSIEEVVKTLVEAIVLVVIVMFVFLQSWRATLIPAIAVPVVLLGTFGVLAAFGYSINTLTLFGMVLAIGLLVDDAIVVVENVERVLEEEPEISVRDAVLKSMEEINVALIAIALVLSAVFLPMAFFGGSVGVIYRQFSLTIVSSMILSVLVALVFSPALAATLLKRKAHGESGGWLARRGRGFNRWFDRNADRYRGQVRRIIARPAPALLLFAGLTAALVLVYGRLPTGFVPQEDQGRTQMQYTLPPGATQDRTMAVVREVERYFWQAEGKNLTVVYTILGQSQAGSGQNTGRGFISYVPWDQRKGEANSAKAVADRASKALSTLRDAQFLAYNPPPIRGLSQTSGFTMALLNSGNLSYQEFKARKDQLLAMASKDPVLAQVRTNSLEDVPTLSVKIDDAKVGALGIQQSTVDETLAAAWGGRYVNDFIDRDRVKRVYVQGDAPFRSRPEDLAAWQVRAPSGQMAPFSAFAEMQWGQSPVSLTRFNGLPAYEFNGQPSEGHSTGDAIKRIAELAAQLPGTSIAWSGQSYQELKSGGQAPLLYSISLLVIFLCLAALYESWSIPLSVMLVIPLGLLGATLAVWARGLENDVFFQVGLLTTMGLSSKNAILIVEFAEQAERGGMSPVEAAISAARLRLRPILMTSLAFIFGVLPLAISTGAGALSRIAIGTAVTGGTLAATVLAIFFVPLFYVLVRKVFGQGHELDRHGAQAEAVPHAHPVAVRAAAE